MTTFKQLILGLLMAKAAAAPVARQHQIPDYSTSEAGNPFLDGWYADPDTEFYNGEYWVFPTSSLAYEEQIYLDAFSSPDLVHWTKHANVLTTENISWGREALWAPAAISRNGKYYLYFGANDILEEEIEQGIIGGIGVAVADAPEGPYIDAIGSPLIGEFHNGAQPIDQDVFIDDDGQAYIYYGGHGHANVAKLNEDMISLGTFDDGATFMEITPESYTEGSQMIKRNGVYYFMWSEGGWTGPDYSVSYAMSDNPLGPFERLDNILRQDAAIARGSGHNGVFHVPDTDIYYMTYHRRALSDTDGNHRTTCYDRMSFNGDGTIARITMLVKDNFADGQLLAWTSSGNAEWSVQDERLHGTGDGYTLLDTNFSDLVFNAKISSSDFTAGIPALIFRASSLTIDDSSSFYWVELHSDAVQLGITTEEGRTILTSGEGSFEDDMQYSVRVTAVGGELKVFVDDMDVPVVETTDDTLSAGKDGVAVIAGGTAVFDDISVARP